MTSRLTGEALTLGYGDFRVADGLNVAIPDGKFTAIIGPNGCGKSTLLRTLSRLMKPLGGQVWLDGQAIQHFATKEVRGALACSRRTPARRGISPLRSW